MEDTHPNSFSFLYVHEVKVITCQKTNCDEIIRSLSAIQFFAENENLVTNLLQIETPDTLPSVMKVSCRSGPSPSGMVFNLPGSRSSKEVWRDPLDQTKDVGSVPSPPPAPLICRQKPGRGALICISMMRKATLIGKLPWYGGSSRTCPYHHYRACRRGRLEQIPFASEHANE
jgi:hypothetical protein